MPTFRSALLSLLLVLAGVAAAAIGALVVDRIGFGPAALVPLSAALVVAGVFWRWQAEGLLTFVVFALLADTTAHWLGVDILLFDEIGLLLLIAVSFGWRRLALDRVKLGWLEAGVLLLTLAGVGSSLVNGVPAVTWIAGLFLLLKGIAFFELTRLLRLRPGDVERVGLALLLLIAAIGVLGGIEWLDPAGFQAALGLPPYDEARADVPVIKSLFLHPALYGWLTAYGSLMCYARFLTHRSWWALPAGLTFNVGTFLSGRRTPLIGVATAVGVGLAWWATRIGLRKALLRIWLPAAGVIVIAALLLAPSLRQLALVTGFEYGPSMELAGEILEHEPRADVIANVHPRIALYVGSVAIARDELPLGGGLGRFGSHLSRENYSPLYERYGLDKVRLLGPDDPRAATDAFWPMVLGETGALGLIGAIVFFVGMVVVLWRSLAATESQRVRMILLAAMFFAIEGLIRSVTSSVYVAPPIAYFVLGSAGVALAAASATDPDPADAERVADQAGN